MKVTLALTIVLSLGCPIVAGCRERLPELDAFKPTFITLQVGSNDIATSVAVDAYRAQLKTILDAAKRTGARVVVLGQNEWFRAPDGRNYGGTFEKRDRFDAVLFEEAKSHGAEVVDLRRLYREQAEKKQWADDGIHPTVIAYDAMASELARVIPSPCGK